MPQPVVTSLDPHTITIVKATVPALQAHGADITAKMYERLFRDEHIRSLFNHANQANGQQINALAGAIVAYASNIDNLGALLPAVERIAQKHVGFHILPEHYPFVATALLGAIEDVLGEAATEEILQAWGQAYWFLAGILQNRESALREAIEQAPGGWTGWRDFVVSEKIRESSIITSFILRPVDGGPVIRHKPGQYITFRFNATEQAGIKRNYSISCAPNGEYYRISVKRSENSQGGSRFMHDEVQVGTTLEITPPAGDFYLPDAPKRPVVLLSGGVGLTPMVSMLETIYQEHPQLQVHYVHSTMSSQTHAMGQHVQSLAEKLAHTKVSTFYSEPQMADQAGENHDVSGMVSLDWLTRNTPVQDADFYICGPKEFMRVFVNGLAASGVPADRIHYEFFGPADELLAA